jgi:hypothetical protein
MEGFESLSPEERSALLCAPALITILVGAADGHLDGEERTWSERLLRSRTYNKPERLNEFYHLVAESFWVRVTSELAHLPAEAEARNAEISARLSDLNPILAKLDLTLAAAIYKGFVGLAQETAKASGGFLRIGAVAKVEEKWVNLPMLTPIAAPKTATEPDAWEAEKEAKD